MAKYRKKPVEIEAVQFVGGPDSACEVIRFASLPGTAYITLEQPDGSLKEHICIATLEGVMQADSGDWVIKGIKGEFYPCKPDIFQATYESAQ